MPVNLKRENQHSQQNNRLMSEVMCVKSDIMYLNIICITSFSVVL